MLVVAPLVIPPLAPVDLPVIPPTASTSIKEDVTPLVIQAPSLGGDGEQSEAVLMEGENIPTPPDEAFM